MVVIIDYKMGNVGSIVNMCKKLGVEACVSADENVIKKADNLILPGVGAFDEGIRQLTVSGVAKILERKVLKEGTPILGICLGMQILTQRSEEGRLPGLGWIDGETVKFKVESDGNRQRIPHMGWNSIVAKEGEPLFDGLVNPRFYFVHSYHVVCTYPRESIATTFYSYDFTSVVRKGNIYGTQFHPEKSHKYGLKLLHNFIGLPNHA